MSGWKTISRSMVTAGAALVLFAVGAVLAQAQTGSSGQSVAAGFAPSREVSDSTGTTAVGQQGLEHRLVLYNTHTAERIDIVYRRGEEYIPAALAKLDYFLRDHVTGDVRHFDPRLYDILSDLTASVGRPAGEIDIVCGYRTPTSNESLRAHTTGVAKHSLHIQAEAIDLRMPGINTLKLREAALALRRGGVGYYPHSDFIHVDTGRVRQWCFECPADLMSGD
jgi:uncharacterized protein YcbK (DUF882 family)